MYTLKTWATETSQPVIRKNLPYSLAFALATKGGHYKAQTICGVWGIILIEVKNN